MRRAIVTLLVLLSFGLKAQVYQAMPQAGYGPVKRMLFDSVLTIPLNINQLRNITGGRDAGQIRYNVSDSGLYVFSGYQWIKANLDSTNISNRINGKLNISDTAAMLLPYMKFIDTVSLSNRINLRVKYSDTAQMLSVYLRKLDTASLSDRINKKQDSIILTTNFKSGAATLVGATLNIPKYSDTLQDNYVPYVGAIKDVDLGAYKLNANTLTADYLLQVKNTPFSITPTSDYTSITPDKTGFVFYTSWLQGQSTYTQSNRFNYANQAQQNNTREYNLPVRNGTLALVEDTVNLSNRINLKADKATVLTINGVGYDLSANRTWTIPTFDSTSISNRINLKLNISDTASMLSPYLRKADTSSLSNRIDLRVKYSDTAAMLSPYLKAAVTSVGLSMPSAFSVTNSPVTSTGTLTVTGAGNTSQYIDGTGALQTMQGIVTEVETLVKEVYNETGATLTKGTVVFINGGHGNLPTVTKAAASSDSLSAQTFGLVKADISDNSNGYVIVIGDLIDMPTNSYTEGTQLYLSPTAGLFTSTKQYAPSHLVYVGVVTRSHPTQGVISVKIQNGYEMDELHNVSAQSPSNNSLLQYKTSTNLWTKVDGTTSNIAEGTNLYYTDARVSNKMNYTDTVSLSNRINTKADALSGTTNTVPKFTSGTTIGNSNIKDDGNVVTINATAGNFGALQVGSYNGNILMNTTNSNGGLIFQNTSSSNKLWDFTTLNNDLVFNESNIAPVMILKAGGNVVISNLSGTGSRMVVADANGVLSTQAITGVDTTSLSNRINLKLNISDTASMLSGYQSAINSKQAAITLTTTGTSGAATFTSNTLNIPQYQAAGTYVTSVTGTSPIVSSGGTTPAISIPAATSSVNGYLSSTDWTTFNGKESALTFSSPLVRTTNTISIPVATTSVNGYLSATDWTTFNNKVSSATLSGYLPLTGGTLTGALGGTTASFSNSANNATLSLLNNNGYPSIINMSVTTATSTARNWAIFSNGTNWGDLEFKPSAANGGDPYTTGTVALRLASTGAATFSNSLEAGKSGALTVGDLFVDNPNKTLYVGRQSSTGGDNTIFIVRNRLNTPYFYINPSNDFAYFNNSNVGIGTTTDAGYKLDVNGTGRFSTSSTDYALTLQNVQDESQGLLVRATDNDGSLYLLNLQSSNGATSQTWVDRFAVTKQGNVGIGTASPGGYLELSSANSGNTQMLLVRNYATSATGSFSGNYTAEIRGASNSNLQHAMLIHLNENNSARRILDVTSVAGTVASFLSNGNVLIGGATDNGQRLQVLGSARITGNGTYTEFSLVDGTPSGSTYFLLSGFPALGDFTIREAGVANHLVIKKTSGNIVINSLAGTGSRAVLADASGTLSAPVSDSSVKENIKTLDYGINDIMKLKPVSFEYIKSYKNYGQGKQIGNIAQDMAKVIPEAVFTTPSTGKMGINYDQLNGVYIKALQELQEQINTLKLEIQTLKNK
jgi:hypothetical protein